MKIPGKKTWFYIKHLTRVAPRSELIFRCPTGADKKVDAEKSDDEQGRGVELQEVSMDVAEIHPLIHGNAYCHSREEESIETWRRTQSEIIKQSLTTNQMQICLILSFLDGSHLDYGIINDNIKHQCRRLTINPVFQSFPILERHSFNEL